MGYLLLLLQAHQQRARLEVEQPALKLTPFLDTLRPLPISVRPKGPVLFTEEKIRTPLLIYKPFS